MKFLGAVVVIEANLIPTRLDSHSDMCVSVCVHVKPWGLSGVARCRRFNAQRPYILEPIKPGHREGDSSTLHTVSIDLRVATPAALTYKRWTHSNAFLQVFIHTCL